jgi:hypothetical protein
MGKVTAETVMEVRRGGCRKVDRPTKIANLSAVILGLVPRIQSRRLYQAFAVPRDEPEDDGETFVSKN